MVAWYDVDRAGLAQLVERRGKAHAIFELVQNSLDTRAKHVEIEVTPVPGAPKVYVEVLDDDPAGFDDLRHAFTMFASSSKKADPSKRGRFNFGEKLFLALCDEAVIRSTTGSVRFDATGRHTSRKRTECGSLIAATMRMTREEYADLEWQVQSLIVPDGVTVTFNGVPLKPRPPVLNFEAVLPTEVADEEGVLRRRERKTLVTLHEARVDEGEVAMLYEMGIPVVETNDRFHVNVHQKVPLTMDRDNVTPAYLRAVRTAVLNASHALLTKEDATAAWVREAAGDERCSDGAIVQVATLRFGDKRVAYDPSDLEGTKLAVAEGYTVVTGGAMSAGEWANAKRAGVILPAGQVTPSPKPYSINGRDLRLIPHDDWTPGMRHTVAFARRLGRVLLDVAVHVDIADDLGLKHAATYGPILEGQAGRLVLNAALLGREWFDRGPRDEHVLALLVHEFAHHATTDHLSAKYHDALCTLGARLALFALDEPSVFDVDGEE